MDHFPVELDDLFACVHRLHAKKISNVVARGDDVDVNAMP